MTQRSKLAAVSSPLWRLAFSAVLLSGTPALSEDRIRTVTYNEDKIVRLPGALGIATSISFGPDERIENVAVGDSLAWQVNPNKRANLIFVKPVQPDASTNMTVVTDKHVYLFDLSPQKETEPTIYSLRFRYPAAPAKATASAEKSSPPPNLNFGWKMTGQKALYPEHCYDDGRAVYLKFASSQTLPAILVAADDGSEGPANYTMRGDTVVITSLPKRVVLRSGRDKAILSSALAPAPQKTAAGSTRTAMSGKP